VNGLSSDLNTLTSNINNNTRLINKDITRFNTLELYNESNVTGITNINISLHAINTSVSEIETLNITQTAKITQATNNISNIDIQINELLSEIEAHNVLILAHIKNR
jgi:hypothetical protein